MRKRHRMRGFRKEEGVASVVGTIMALMVFLAFISLFTTQYVPVWMTDNEANHMATVLNQFGSIKQSIDTLIATENRDISMYNTVTLGSGGVPVFASETLGELSLRLLTRPPGKFRYCAGDFNITTCNSGMTPTWTLPNANTTGSLRLYAPNRYYVEQKIAFENGAIIIWQPDGVFVKSWPHFRAWKTPAGSTGCINVSFTLINFYSYEETSIAGITTEGVHTLLLHSEKTFNSWGKTPKNLTVRLNSDYFEGWFDYFNRTLTKNLGSGTVSWDNYDHDPHPTNKNDVRVDSTHWRMECYNFTLKDKGNLEIDHKVFIWFKQVNNLALNTGYIQVAVGSANIP